MGDRRLGLAVVGCGMAAKPHARALQDLSDLIEVRGVYARSPGRRTAFCAEYGFSQAESLDALVADERVEAALILTPPNARQDLVDRFSAAGKAILTEKPIERTTAAAEAIVAQCADRGVTLGIVLQHRFREGAERLTALMGDKALGPLATVQLVVPWWREQAYYDEPGRGTYARDGGGVLISQAIHSMDLMLSLTGPIVEVQAVAGTTPFHRMEAEDFVGAGLRFANGAMGSLMATTAAWPGAAEHLTLWFENATARLDASALTLDWRDGRQEVVGTTSGTGGGADPMAFPHDWHRALIADFANAVLSGGTPRVTGAEALKVHRLIDALITSSTERRAIAPAG